MTTTEPKAMLSRYLQSGRDAMLWKLQDLSEYDVRRPLTPTGTNLLGMVKHLASVEFGYFGETFGRRSEESLPWLDEGAEPNTDMWVPADQSRQEVLDLYHRAWAHSDLTIRTLPLEAVGRVPWWPDERSEVSLQHVLVHMIAETHRHAGHADILRELIDGAAGLAVHNDNLAPGDARWWADYRQRLETSARQFR